MFKKGDKPWNAGKKGVVCGNIKGCVSCMTGKKHSQKTKDKISQSKKGVGLPTKGKKHWWKCTKSFKKGHTPWNKGKEYISHLGSGNPNWKGGKSFEPYSVDWTKTLKKSIKERDHYTCQICHKEGVAVHHIDYDKLNCNPNNLVTLCRKCHTKTNFNRDYWIKYFNND